MKSLSNTILVFLLALGTASFAYAEEAATSPTPATTKKPSPLLGAPVNIGMAGGAVLPAGRAITALNVSYRDKTHPIEGGAKTPDIFSQVWLLKLRYGLYDRLEISTVGAYVNNRRDNMTPQHIEGIGDQTLGLSFAVFSERAGDPLWLTISPSLILPTGQRGDSRPPGGGAMGGRAAVSLTKFFNPHIKGDMDFIWQAPFERGNQDVKSGSHYTWNSQVRYLFTKLPMDIGLESILVKTESGDKTMPNGTARNLKNGLTEWVIGPSFNLAIEPWGMWFGAGVFFPVWQDAAGPTKVERVRFDLKLAKFW